MPHGDRARTRTTHHKTADGNAVEAIILQILAFPSSPRPNPSSCLPGCPLREQRALGSGRWSSRDLAETDKPLDGCFTF